MSLEVRFTAKRQLSLLPEESTLYSSECIQAGLEVGVGWLPVHVDPSIVISIYSSLINII